MAVKYQFSPNERFAIWQTYNFQCFWCGVPIRLQDVTVDHVIPEHLLDHPDDLAATIKLYALGDDFAINDFGNWVPCHGSCNSKKRTKLYNPSPALIAILHDVCKNGKNAKKVADKIINNIKADKLLGMLQIAVSSGNISKVDLMEIFEITHPSPKSIKIDEALHCFHLPDNWTVVNVEESSEMATVVSGNLSGVTPISKAPHHSWQCPTCGHYGPWSGAMCLSCGHLSDGD